MSHILLTFSHFKFMKWKLSTNNQLAFKEVGTFKVKLLSSFISQSPLKWFCMIRSSNSPPCLSYAGPWRHLWFHPLSETKHLEQSEVWAFDSQGLLVHTLTSLCEILTNILFPGLPKLLHTTGLSTYMSQVSKLIHAVSNFFLISLKFVPLRHHQLLKNTTVREKHFSNTS